MDQPKPTFPPVHTQYGLIPAYLTKDGSVIRELLHPNQSAAQNQSLAEATVAVGQTTALHLHHATEEIYHITQGEGVMTLGVSTFRVVIGDSVVIRPGTPHCIQNTGTVALTILCACSPPYQHDDTQLL
jgi:mannose-6-phosphate isomerase-like protein (cupin superfamily)